MKKQRPELFFALVIFLIGTALLLITPAGANFDEETYVARIWEMGLGHFIPNSYLDTEGGFPNAFLKISYRRQINVPIINLEVLKEQAKVKIDWDDFSTNETRAGYFPTTFILQAAIMRIMGAHFQLPVLYLYYLLRFSYLLLYSLLVYLAIRVLPFGKWVFGTLALTPMCLIQAASISADPIAIGVGFLFTAWILKLCSDASEGMTKKELIITSLLILAVGTLKTNMVFLLLLLFILPARKVAKNKAWMVVLVSSIISMLLAFGWIYITSQIFTTDREGSGIYPAARLFSIFTDPLEFLKNVTVTISGRLATFYKQAVGVSGYGYWLLPNLVYWLFPLAVFLAFFNEKNPIQLTLKQRILFGLAGLFNIAMVFVIFYVAETPVDYVGIWGIQGRYFDPFIPLLLIPFMFKLRWRLTPAITGVLATLLAVVVTVTLFLDFHAICGSTWFNGKVCAYPYYKNWDPSTFRGVEMDENTTITQGFVVDCNQLSQIRVWIKQYEPVKNELEFFTLETQTGQPLRTAWIRSEEIPQSGWLVIDMPPTLYQRNQELQFRLLPNGKGGIPQLELARFPTLEYSRGVVSINNESLDSSLVFQYTCLDGISNLLK